MSIKRDLNNVLQDNKYTFAAYLIIDGIELGQHNAIDEPWISHLRVVGQRLVELGQLVDGFVAHQSLAHEQHQVGLVHRDQL